MRRPVGEGQRGRRSAHIAATPRRCVGGNPRAPQPRRDPPLTAGHAHQVLGRIPERSERYGGSERCCRKAVQRQCKGNAPRTRTARRPAATAATPTTGPKTPPRTPPPPPGLPPRPPREQPDRTQHSNTQTLKQSRTPRTMAGSQICGPALYGVRLQRHRQRVGVAGGDRGEDGGDQRGGLPGGEGEVECLPGRRGADLEPRAAVSRLGQRAAGRQAGGQGAQTGAAARAA